jgi:hypothetical protein
MRFALTLLVLALDCWAIVSILGARAAAKSKVGWTVLVVALPLAGALMWRQAGRKAYIGPVSEHERGVHFGS